MDPCGNGYDIYDLFDLGEFDQKGSVPTKWGSKTDLEEMAYQARSLGIGLIWDAVLNHKAGAEYPERFDAVAVDPKRTYISDCGLMLFLPPMLPSALKLLTCISHREK